MTTSEFLAALVRLMQFSIFEINKTPIAPSSLVVFEMVIPVFAVASRIPNVISPSGRR